MDDYYKLCFVRVGEGCYLSAFQMCATVTHHICLTSRTRRSSFVEHSNLYLLGPNQKDQFDYHPIYWEPHRHISIIVQKQITLHVKIYVYTVHCLSGC